MENKPNAVSGKTKEKPIMINGIEYQWGDISCFIKVAPVCSAKEITILIGFINDKGERAPK